MRAQDNANPAEDGNQDNSQCKGLNGESMSPIGTDSDSYAFFCVFLRVRRKEGEPSRPRRRGSQRRG